MTPEQFYAETVGKVIDFDGAYGPQCVDAFRYWGKLNSVPIPPTPNNYADGFWYSRDELGFSKWFDYIQPGQFRHGDWIIWPRGSSHNMSHVAMYYVPPGSSQAFEYSENQGGSGGFCLKQTNFSDALGGFRWKGYETMQIEKGYHHLTYKGIEVDIIRATAASGYKLHLLSADGPFTVKDIMEYDSDRLAIVGAVNANYFEMSTGMHLGCEGDGWVNGYWQAPKKAGIISYYISDLGKIGAHDQADFWLSQSEVQMVCAPYSVLIHNGQNTDLRSASFGSKELIKNTQTAILRIQDDWCLAIFSECFPSDVHAFAQEAGANELALMDSGGSTQMFECATTGHRRAVRHTGRLLPNVLVLAKEISPDGTPELPAEPQPEPEPEPIEDEPVQSPEPAADPDGGTDQMKTLLPDRVYDILKWICLIALPALSAFVLFMGTDLSAQYELIAKWINGIMILLGSLIGVSTVQYNSARSQDK